MSDFTWPYRFGQYHYVRPKHYDLSIFPNIDDRVFEGEVTITVPLPLFHPWFLSSKVWGWELYIAESTRYLVLHSKGLVLNEWAMYHWVLQGDAHIPVRRILVPFPAFPRLR